MDLRRVALLLYSVIVLGCNVFKRSWRQLTLRRNDNLIYSKDWHTVPHCLHFAFG